MLYPERDTDLVAELNNGYRHRGSTSKRHHTTGYCPRLRLLPRGSGRAVPEPIRNRSVADVTPLVFDSLDAELRAGFSIG
jgi:hypothetical protein